MKSRASGCGRGFTLIELLVVIAIIALLIALLLPALGKWKQTGRTIVCSVQMKQYGTATHSYAADYTDKIFSFTWTRSLHPVSPNSPVYSLFNATTTDIQAAHYQARDAIWRRAGWDFGDQANWIPHILYTHLVLLDYMAMVLPAKFVVCPEDTNRLRWQSQVEIARDGTPPPPYPRPPQMSRWPFGSSYQMTVSSFGPDGGPNAVGYGGSHRFYLNPTGNDVLGKRKLGDVSFPSGKVQTFDGYARHMGKRQYFYGYTEAKSPVLMFDQSVAQRRTGDANRGYDPRAPFGTGYLIINYDPDDPPDNWESPTLRGDYAPENYAGGYYQWTRSGLKGVDFNSSEVPFRGA